ncbi:adaptin ear-binding coat-associated protein 1 NECAP-1 [Piedraia hortae CBS 480.64]|uniref:Adaptin ear-binding coat-associated protein 1 NECAP-1 n=1 Tax=Piedraia hortae CBS 480.64 TaxID=1314780 RepID=A0A6A7C2Q5_9PEZI|nr:adaptin ear-binding coat-associated protein 1 NECAP-1 [Piedraia hortae CBS 480.64]
MTAKDPATGRHLEESAIQRVLFATENVHVFTIPPITSTKGFAASGWSTTGKEIFKARLRIIETTVEAQIKVDIVLEDSGTGELFAAAPYTNAAVVQQANDSSRFFALRVQGEGGMKATLGIMFEERGAAFDFNVALTEGRKALDGPQKDKRDLSANKQDFSLKEGEEIHVEVGHMGRRRPAPVSRSEEDDQAALFSIAPPPPPAKASRREPVDEGGFGEFQ